MFVDRNIYDFRYMPRLYVFVLYRAGRARIVLETYTFCKAQSTIRRSERVQGVHVIKLTERPNVLFARQFGR
jgi:hypothetical protein